MVVHTAAGRVLLLKRADHPDFWQSVTGSLEWGEECEVAVARELREETGLVPARPARDLGVAHHYPILPRWRYRYAPNVRENLEHAYALELPGESDITLNPAEHCACGWFDWREAAEKVASWTNREAILAIARGKQW